TPAERVLTRWARSHRFAGSGDRAAIRDHVFDALRRRRTLARLGGGETGRALMLGSVRAGGYAVENVFSGDRFAPDPLTAAERAYAPAPESEGDALDLPDWLLAPFRDSLGDDLAPVANALRQRAPVFLRANLLKTDRAGAIAALAEDGIVARHHPLAETALEVIEGARRVNGARAYRDGRVELQDAASQAVVEALGQGVSGARVLDYCAGGGGKALALAARGADQVVAHDVDAGRMRDLPVRAARAGARVSTVAPGGAPCDFDLVLVDAPCSGSGAWRRQPDAKWRLTPERLDMLQAMQSQILDAAAAHVAPTGRLAYATCSMLLSENSVQIEAFLGRSPGWVRAAEDLQLTPIDGGDGFFLAQLTRATAGGYTT
ncbi:MAG: RsmB/NOP family class I SAM-dependent RNA methyltransferase, partial [Pseudomonadota bacterium]